MWDELWLAIALLLIIEGIMPFINPAGIRRMLVMIIEMDDNALRVGGLASMIIGLLILYTIN